jgi:hypothetical protein
VPFVVVTPNQLKKFTSGIGGQAKKENILKDLLKRFEVDVDNNNVADATALHFMARAFLGEPMPKPLVSFQIEVLDAIREALKEPLSDCRLAKDLLL